MAKQIDLNCDMGESFGAYRIGSDEELLPNITSANIACGAHAGDPNVMDRAVQMTKKYGVHVGAHPGFPDIAGFGRRMIEFTPQEIYRMVVYQVGALMAFCNVHDVSMQHVKPHGAMYNAAAKDREIADAIAQAVRDVNARLILFGLAGSELLKAGKAAGLQVASEVFADRTYQDDGTLTPRNKPDSLITDPRQAAGRIEKMISKGFIQANTGEKIDVQADTICIHGDGAHAVEFAKNLHQSLIKLGVEISGLN